MAAATVFTTVGKGLVTARLAATSGISAALAPYVGFGSGSTTATVSDTTLTTEFTTGTDAGYARATGTGSQQTTTVSNDTYQVQASHTAGSAITVNEAANFDASTAGNMMIHSSFASGVGMSIGDVFTIKLQVQFT